MKPSNKISANGTSAPISGFRRVSRILLWIVGIIVSIALLILWTFAKPLIRLVGWLFLIFSVLAIVYWLLSV